MAVIWRWEVYRPAREAVGTGAADQEARGVVEGGTEAGEEAIVAVGRTMTSMSLEPSTSSQVRGGRTAGLVLLVRVDGR